MQTIPHRPIADACDISQEIIDMIIDQLAEDLPSLRACALLCRRWLRRSHYHLFRLVEFTDAKAGSSVYRWCTTFPGAGGDTPARFTKELRFAQTRKLWLHPGTLLSRLPQLYAFSNVQTLVIASLTTSVFHPITLPVFFGHVFPQVLNLRLHYPVACTTSLVRFILTFPNISNLEVQHPRWVKSACGDRSSQGPRGSCRSPFDGTLFLCRFGEKFDEFISLLAEQPINFRKVRLRQCGFSSTPAIHNLLDAISGTLRVLDVAFLEREQKWVPLTVPGCNALNVLAIDMAGGVQMEEVVGLVSSIVSARLEIFALGVGERGATPGRGTGSSNALNNIGPLDKPLSELARRVYVETGKRITLILVANDPSGLVERLPEFRRVGNTWRGEKVIGSGRSDHLWSFLAASESEFQGIDESILDFVRL